MLALPEGFITRRSVNTHNLDVIALTDWVEASVMFVDDELSISDVVDALCENNVYRDQDFAREIVDVAWSQLRLRSDWMGISSPFRVRSSSVESAVPSWKDAVASAFLLTLALAPHYKPWAKQFGHSYIDQGYLFERVAAASLQAHGWRVHHTGWASGIQNEDFGTVVAGVAHCLREPTVSNEMVARYQASNEKGLDLVCYRPFIDERAGIPVYLMQCASGADWEGKKHTPDLNVWTKLITFSTNPRRGFVLPFALDNERFLMTCHAVDGMVLERYRLLSAGSDGTDWIPADLKEELTSWLEPRIAALPTDQT